MCLKIRLKSALKNAFSFSFDARRISVMFSVIVITGFAIVFSLIYFASYLPTDVMPFSKLAVTVPNYAGNLIIMSILLAAIVSLSALLSILIKGAFIHNYTIRDSKEGTIKKSIDALTGRVAPIINLTLLIILASIVFDSIPVFGGLISIFFSLAVFFAYQELIIAKKGAIDSIKSSYSMFKENWKDVIVSIFAVIVSAFLITAIFLIPFIVALFSTIAQVPAESLVDPNFVPELSAALSRNVLSLIILGAIAVIGLAISNLFSNGFTTDVYLQLKGKKTDAGEVLKSKKAETFEVVSVAPKSKKAAKRKPAKKKILRKK